jgi:hypothetical protein
LRKSRPSAYCSISDTSVPNQDGREAFTRFICISFSWRPVCTLRRDRRIWIFRDRTQPVTG